MEHWGLTLTGALVAIAVAACGKSPDPAAPAQTPPPAQQPPAGDPGIVKTPPAVVDPKVIERSPESVDPGMVKRPPAPGGTPPAGTGR